MAKAKKPKPITLIRTNLPRENSPSISARTKTRPSTEAKRVIRKYTVFITLAMLLWFLSNEFTTIITDKNYN